MYGYNCMICFMKRKINYKNCLFQNKMGRKQMDRHIDEYTGQCLMTVEVGKYLGVYVYLL